MAGWHHRLNGHGFVQTLGVGDGQEGLAYCDSWGCEESDTTERLNRTEEFYNSNRGTENCIYSLKNPFTKKKQDPLELIYLITRSLYTLTNILYFAHLPASKSLRFILFL